MNNIETCQNCKSWKIKAGHKIIGHCDVIEQDFTKNFTCGFWEEDVNDEDDIEEHCNFCGKSKSEITQEDGHLLGTGGSYICGECITICNKVIARTELGLKNIT